MAIGIVLVSLMLGLGITAYLQMEILSVVLLTYLVVFTTKTALHIIKNNNDEIISDSEAWMVLIAIVFTTAMAEVLTRIIFTMAPIIAIAIAHVIGLVFLMILSRFFDTVRQD